MYFLIIALPLVGFLSGGLVGRLLGGIGVGVITTLLLFFTFVLSAILLCKILFTGNIYMINIGKWIYTDTLQIDWHLHLDGLTALMLVVVTFVSMLVHLYSTEYMEHDPHLPRFMSYLSLFTFFMIILVTAGNFLQMFVGWEGVGLSSFLLINFWFTRIQANKSAIKAMLVNRVGDFFLLLAMFAIYNIFDTLDYNSSFTLIPFAYHSQMTIIGMSTYVIDWICVCILFGAMGKSAQIGLHTWLPDAMEGPTPVSALIHAATMVTAGIFLISRCSYIFEHSNFALNLAIVFGSLTALFASSVAVFQTDIKKIIAYSTCSQLGYMFAACGLSGYDIAIFHLYNHAFFKALLFLGAGSIVHGLEDEQDIRKMGGLYKVLPLTSTIMIIGSFALCAYPFTSGFYSKDTILALSLTKQVSLSYFAYGVGLLAALFTAIYSGILSYSVTSLEQSRLSKKQLLKAHEGSWRIVLSLVLLCLMTIFSGYISKETLIGTGSFFWGTSIFFIPFNYHTAEVEFIDTEYKLLSAITFFLIGFLSTGCFFYKDGILKGNFLKPYLYSFFYNKWNFDNYYNMLISQNILETSILFTYKSIDRGLLEKIGPFNLVRTLNKIVQLTRTLQDGYISSYLIYLILSISFFLSFSIIHIENNFFTLVVFLYIIAFYKK